MFPVYILTDERIRAVFDSLLPNAGPGERLAWGFVVGILMALSYGITFGIFAATATRVWRALTGGRR